MPLQLHFDGPDFLPPEHPVADDVSPADLDVSEAALNRFNDKGYLVVRGLLTPDETKSFKEEIRSIIADWPDRAPASCFAASESPVTQLVDFDPRIARGQLTPASKELGVRRLFRMVLHNDRFRRLAHDPRLTGFVRRLWGDDIKLLQSMALLKPPGGEEKRWHQDNAYFRLVPHNVAAYWIALDDADYTNGCMCVVPGSHRRGVQTHVAPDDPHVYYSLKDKPAPGEYVQIPMRAGDAMVFSGHLLHYTPPNRSDLRRRAIQLHYADAHCRPTRCPRDGSMPIVEPVNKEVFSDSGALPVDRLADPAAAPVFDCDPSGPCTEPQYWYYRKAEMLISGRDLGDDFI